MFQHINNQQKATYWDEGVFNSSKWLYDLYVPSMGVGIVHIPLVYLTKLHIQQEIYAASLIDLPFLLGLETLFKPAIIDGVVVRFPLSNLEPFRTECFNILANSVIVQSQLAKQMIFLKKWLPLLCIKAEKEYLTNNKVSPILMKRLFRLLVRCLSINLANPFIEIVFMRINKIYSQESYYQNYLKKITWPPIFSHLSFFSNEVKQLGENSKQGNVSLDEILEFCWTLGFLGNSIGDGSEYESPQYVMNLIGSSLALDNTNVELIDPNKINLPKFKFDPAALTDIWVNRGNSIENTLYFLRFLQVNEELRHYWGLRLIRLFRLIAPDVESIQAWGISDYEKFLKK